MAGLTRPEIYRIVNNYIGGSGGYLGDFSYRSHAEFYPAYCDLDIDPYALEGTTRDRFLSILTGSPPDVQARIARGVLAKYPVGSGPQRTQTLHDEIVAFARRLEGAAVAQAALAITSDTVELAIRDAEALLSSNGATSALDRLHTAIHGYLMTVLDAGAISYAPESSLTSLYKLLRETHPAFQDDSPFSEEIQRILRGFSSVLDTLNTLRNNASIAHPNAVLLDEPEAMLTVNVVRTVLRYLDSKISAYAAKQVILRT